MECGSLNAPSFHPEESDYESPIVIHRDDDILIVWEPVESDRHPGVGVYRILLHQGHSPGVLIRAAQMVPDDATFGGGDPALGWVEHEALSRIPPDALTGRSDDL